MGCQDNYVWVHYEVKGLQNGDQRFLRANYADSRQIKLTEQLATFFHINCGLMIRAMSPDFRGEEASIYK